MLKAHKKGIRRAANNTFGYIAKNIGPQDVLATLLGNLRNSPSPTYCHGQVLTESQVCKSDKAEYALL